ncbi:MAG: acyl-CoA thioesterase [Thermoguttaceae bacterium]|nr:acyl-CoA thioesterase [Thermoguttaceae bacterium]
MSGKTEENVENGKTAGNGKIGKGGENGGSVGAVAAEPFEGTIQFRVRYAETDQMGVVYHGNYFTYFEMGRTELLREATGVSYRDVEESATKMVVVKAECSFIKPAKYDDLLTLKTRVLRTTRASLEHEYRLFRDGELLAVGKTKLATVDNAGKIVPVPDWIKNLARPRSSETSQG